MSYLDENKQAKNMRVFSTGLDIPTKILKYTFDILDRHAKMVK